MSDPLISAIQSVGGQVALAARLGIKQQAVQQWERVPPERVLAVAQATGWRVTPHKLRPDLYPHPEDGLPRQLRKRRRSS